MYRTSRGSSSSRPTAQLPQSLRTGTDVLIFERPAHQHVDHNQAAISTSITTSTTSNADDWTTQKVKLCNYSDEPLLVNNTT